MNRHPKVVHLNQSNDSAHGPVQAHLPLPLIKLRDDMAERLRRQLRSMLDQVDDALFQRADRAGSNMEQEIYFSAMREIRLKRQGLELAFVQALGAAFLDLGRQPAEPPTNVTEIDPNTLSLVQNDELEERVAIDGMVSKARDRFAQAIQQLSIRIDSLLPAVRVLDEQNPLAPRRLCEAFVQACRDIDVDIRVKLVVLKLFDKVVLESLGELYDRANRLLADLGVLPDLKPPRVTARQATGVRQINARGGAEVSAESGEEAEAEQETFGILQALMAGQRAQAGTASTVIPMGQQQGDANLPALNQAELLKLLSMAQGQLAQADKGLPGQTPNGVLDVERLLSGMLRQGGRSGRIHQVDGDVVNLVSMLFEFILNDRQLPAIMKAQLARLQIPVLKVALLDKTFFGKAEHPARQLLNELARAGLGWNERAPGESDPLREKIEDIVQRLVTEFALDLKVFEEVLVEFQQFMQQEQRRGQLVEQRTRDAELGRAKTELARREVSQALDGILQERSIPDSMLKLVREGWSNVMVLIHLKQGTTSPEWEQALNLARDLVWSLDPTPEPGARQRLLHLIPGLLKGLREGLSTTSFSPFEMDRLLKDLERLHLRALQRLSGRLERVPPATEVEHEAKRSSAQPSADEAGDARDNVQDSGVDTARKAADTEISGAEVESPRTISKVSSQASVLDTAEERNVESTAVRQTLKADSPDSGQPTASAAEVPEDVLRRIDALGIGCWMEFCEADGTKFRAKLAAVISAIDKYVFVNRSGVKVAERTRLELAAELHQGRVAVLDDGLLFDRALAAVIGNLRSARQA